MRGQLKMFETVGVLVVFFILLVVGAVFYFNVQSSSLERERVAASDRLPFQVSFQVLHSPELSCSFLSAEREGCIDVLKIVPFADLLSGSSRSSYSGVFGFSTISISSIYPPSVPVTLYDNVPLVYSSNVSYRSPVLLYDVRSDRYSFGVVEVVSHV